MTDDERLTAIAQQYAVLNNRSLGLNVQNNIVVTLLPH